MIIVEPYCVQRYRSLPNSAATGGYVDLAAFGFGASKTFVTNWAGFVRRNYKVMPKIVEGVANLDGNYNNISVQSVIDAFNTVIDDYFAQLVYMSATDPPEWQNDISKQAKVNLIFNPVTRQFYNNGEIGSSGWNRDIDGPICGGVRVGLPWWGRQIGLRAVRFLNIQPKQISYRAFESATMPGTSGGLWIFRGDRFYGDMMDMNGVDVVVPSGWETKLSVPSAPENANGYGRMYFPYFDFLRRRTNYASNYPVDAGGVSA